MSAPEYMLTTDQNYDLLDGLRVLLYDQPGCAVGGPLHVQLDDGNLGDAFMSLDGYPCIHDYDANTIALCNLILEVLKSLPEHEREFWMNGRIEL